MTAILYLGHHMAVFYVTTLVVILYIGHDVCVYVYIYIPWYIFYESHCFCILC
jgi:hypothetical protein